MARGGLDSLRYSFGMRSWVGGAVVIALAAVLLAACAHSADYAAAHCEEREAYTGSPLHPPVQVSLAEIPERPLPDSTVRRLDSALALLESHFKIPAYSLSVAAPGKGRWERSRTSPDTPLLFWASIGKTFIAVVILQLAEEGRLSLDDTVSRWVEGVPNGNIATVRDLLAHTAGIFSANEDLNAHKAHRYFSLSENLAIARRHGAMFCPGSRWRYSNTGYEVLGEIIRKADGRNFNEAITARILAPLGLDSLKALSPDGDIRLVSPLVSSKEKPIDPRWAGAAGSLVGTAGDMSRFWAALYQGRLIPLDRVREMSRTLYPMFDPGMFYGLGMVAFDLPDRNPGDTLRWIGHAGGTPGMSAIAVYSPGDTALVTVAVTGEVPAVPIANLLLKAIRRSP